MNSLRNYEINFLNTMSYLPGTYSCAIDCFMELTHKIFMPLLADIENKSLFSNLFMMLLVTMTMLYKTITTKDLI